MTKERAIELAQKLYRLAKRGVGGEALNAQELLFKLVQKFDLNPESFAYDLHYNEITKHKFKYNSRYKFILMSVIHKVLNLNSFSYWKVRGSKTEIELKCSKIQAIEIETQYDLYVQGFEKEYAKLKRAFIHANKIFAKEDETNKSQRKEKPLTPQERAELWEVLQMAQGINPTEIYKMIE